VSPQEGWYPDPELRGVGRWWDGHAWTGKRQPTVAIACGQCGAGHLLLADYRAGHRTRPALLIDAVNAGVSEIDPLMSVRRIATMLFAQ
jgi:Protein of unknown function (DUF2510)